MQGALIIRSSLIPALRSSVRSRRHLAIRAMAPFTYQWARPALTVDTVIVAKPSAGHEAQLLLIQRKNPPFKVRWPHVMQHCVPCGSLHSPK